MKTLNEMVKKKIVNVNKKSPKTKEITKNMTFGEAISKNPAAARILAEEGMFCGGCPMAMMETIEQGAMAHGVEVDKLIKKINKKK